MTTFRYKPDKIKYLTRVDTLDTVHKMHVSNFENKRQKKESLKAEKSQIENKLNILENSEHTIDENIITNIKHRSLLKSRIQKINQELFDIENNISELEYYSQTNDILLDYYNENSPLDNNYNLENTTSNDQQVIDNNNNNNNIGKSKLEELNLLSQKKRKSKKVTRRRVRKNDIITTKSILDFFNDTPEIPNAINNVTINTTKATPNITTNSANNDTTMNDKSDNTNNNNNNTNNNNTNNNNNNNNNNNTNNSVEQIVSNKATLFDDYMTLVDKTYFKKKHNLYRICTKCNIELTLIPADGFYVCQKCGQVDYAIVESEVSSHKDSINEKVHYPYKRLNHLVEWARQEAYICIFRGLYNASINFLIIIKGN